MAWTALKAAIAETIKANGNQEITGTVLQTEINRVIDELGAAQGYKGKATPSTNPGAQDGNIFYTAETVGVYVNMGGVEIAAADGLYIISLVSGTWSIEKVFSAGFDPSDLAEVTRKTLSPYSYVSYLPDDTPFTTPSLTLNVPTKILVPTTIKSANAFAVVDKGGGDFAVQYQGPTTETFKIFMSTSMTAGTNNVVFEMFMYRNGVAEPGIAIARKISSGADVGAISVLGEFTADPNDFIEIYVLVSLTSTITFDKTSIIITEKN